MTVATSVSIGRTLLGLGDLVFDDSGVYKVGQFSTDGTRWTRSTVTSPWVNGRVLRAATKDVKTVTGDFLVVSDLSTDPSTHDGAVAAVLAALDQFAYTLSITAGGLTRSWACEPADVAPGQGESFMTNDTDRWTTVTASIPVNPIPVSGAW